MDGENLFDQRLILPIGHRVEQHRVRRGATVHDLTEQQLGAWVAAHGSSDAVTNNVRWQRGFVEDVAGNTHAPIDELIGLGLLAEVAPGTDQALEFAEGHRLIPLMLGLGNAVDDPSMFEIGFRGQAFVQVNSAIYDLWHWSAMDDTLWATCQSAADVARRSADTDTEPRALLSVLLESLHLLLLRNAACLDVDFRLGQPNAA